ncbi:hypothetical protein G7Y79_00025g058070 [Physcia stellaris]|nr:hypothetical protein G7Y79_00025g058070 [Physcia stellaris]
MHSSLELILSPLKSTFSIASLRDIPSPIETTTFAALIKLEGHSAKAPQGVTRKPRFSAPAKLARRQIQLPKVAETGLPNELVNEQGVKPSNLIRRQAFNNFLTVAMSRFPSLQVNGLSSVSEDPTSATTPTERSAEREEKRLAMLHRMRPPPLKYAWNFYHDKYSETKSYDERITLILDNVVTLKPFWGFLNNFPMHSLKLKDSVHFFKRGVKPVWEDSRNINGGSWTFRIPKDKSEQFWQEVLMLAIGEQFAPNLQPRKSYTPSLPSSPPSISPPPTIIHQLLPPTPKNLTLPTPGDDICGITYTTRFNSNLITIWNRAGTDESSIASILSTVLANISAELRPKDGAYFYKKHSMHAGFEGAVAKARADARAKIERSEAMRREEESGDEDEALVTVEEGNLALLRDAEGEDVEGQGKV